MWWYVFTYKESKKERENKRKKGRRKRGYIIFSVPSFINELMVYTYGYTGFRRCINIQRNRVNKDLFSLFIYAI